MVISVHYQQPGRTAVGNPGRLGERCAKPISAKETSLIEILDDTSNEVDHTDYVVVAVGDGEMIATRSNAKRMLQTCFVQSSIHMPKIEEAGTDQRHHVRRSVECECTQGRSFAINEVQRFPIWRQSEAAWLRESRFACKTVCNPFGTAAGETSHLARGEIEYAKLMRPGIGEEQKISRYLEVPRRGKGGGEAHCRTTKWLTAFSSAWPVS